MIHSFTVPFGAKYLTGMVTSVPPYENFSLTKNNILRHQSKNYKNHFENSNFWGMWPLLALGHVGHVTHNFINMLFISTIIVVYHSINKAIPLVIWWYALLTNFVGMHYRKCRFKTNRVVLINVCPY
jgi:hypothetical protein